MSKNFYIEFARDINYKNEQIGYMKCYETTIDGYKEAVKDLKVYKANQAKHISDLEGKLALTEKALELACIELNKNINDKCEYCEYKENNIDYGSCDCDEQFETDRTVNYFKTKAKEIMKSE